MEVRRASHVHQIPQMILPQRLPVTTLMHANTKETSMIDAETASYFRLPVAKYTTPSTSAMKNPVNAVKTAGTWKKIIR